MKTRTSLLTVALCLFFALPTLAQEGYLKTFMSDFDGASDKLNSLAEAMPADKFSWGPEGVRSVSQVFIHVSAANFFLAQALGVPAPDTFGRDAEQTITKKDEVIATLKQSQDHVRKVVKGLMGQDLSAEVEAFGQTMSKYRVLFIIGGHTHEHLGQSIAYARMNGIAPPWSQGGN